MADLGWFRRKPELSGARFSAKTSPGKLPGTGIPGRGQVPCRQYFLLNFVRCSSGAGAGVASGAGDREGSGELDAGGVAGGLGVGLGD